MKSTFNPSDTFISTTISFLDGFELNYDLALYYIKNEPGFTIICTDGPNNSITFEGPMTTSLAQTLSNNFTADVNVNCYYLTDNADPDSEPTPILVLHYVTYPIQLAINTKSLFA